MATINQSDVCPSPRFPPFLGLHETGTLRQARDKHARRLDTTSCWVRRRQIVGRGQRALTRRGGCAGPLAFPTFSNARAVEKGRRAALN